MLRGYVPLGQLEQVVTAICDFYFVLDNLYRILIFDKKISILFNIKLFMNTLKNSFLLFITLFFFSCNSSVHKNRESYELRSTDEYLKFPLNSKTSLLIKAICPFLDDGTEYLTFQNNMESEILVYNMKKQTYVRTISFDREGPNGIGWFGGYYIKGWNEIYLPDMMRSEINIVNSDGRLLRTISYAETVQGKKTIPFTSLTSTYTPMVFIGHQLYIPQTINLMYGSKALEDSPVTVVLDTLTYKLKELPFRFPKIMSLEDVKNKSLGSEYSYSRCFDGKNFIYSFFFDENIYITPPSHKRIDKIAVKSRYINELKFVDRTPDNLNLVAKALSELPFYSNLIYDKYRNVYYRFVFPKVELPTNEKNYAEIWQMGRTKFSIIILNDQFEVIGETLFPENVYASTQYFIRKDGLYLSTSFPKNPNFDENTLSFQRIELVKL
jgi:hypothetical protein